MTNPDQRTEGKNPSGWRKRHHRPRGESVYLPDEVQRGFRQSRSNNWRPLQHRSKEAFPDGSQHQQRGRRRDDFPYQHIDGVPNTTTRGRQRISEAQNGYGFFYWQKKAYFKRKLGIINKIIKANHHINQMSKETPPCLLNKLPLILGNNNKPAMPSDDTHKEIRDNAKNCQKKTILTLEDYHK